MYSLYLKPKIGISLLTLGLTLLMLSSQAGWARQKDSLRVCADPNNLPFSNQAGEGFENALARLLADSMQRELEYVWYPQRRGFFRHTLNAGKCDLVMGVLPGLQRADTTAPYYRSSYVFVTRQADKLQITSLDDPRLGKLKVGVPVVGDDYSNTPGASAMARRGYIHNLTGFSVYGDYSKPHPASRIIEALATKAIDVAIVWGPVAGFFADQQAVALDISPVTPAQEQGTRFTFPIAMAVRQGDTELKQEVERVMREQAVKVSQVLRRYRVPMLEMANHNSSQE